MFSLLVVQLFIVVLTFGQLYCLLVCYIVYFLRTFVSINVYTHLNIHI